MPDVADATRVGNRLEAWRRTGELSSLWPDVTPEALHEAHGRIRAATASVLGSPDGAASPPFLEEPHMGGDRALGIAAFVGGMGPLLGWWIEAGRLGASPGAARLLLTHLAHGRRRNAVLRDVLSRIVRAMRRAGVEPVLLKGMHTGAAYFPEPGARPAADVDLLVRPGERDRAADALGREGLVEMRSTRFASRSEWAPAGGAREVRSLELEHAEDPWSVDLHVSLERWYFRGLRTGLGGPASLATRKVRIGDVSVQALAQPHLTAFLAQHASHELTRVRLIRVVELVLVVGRDVERGLLRWGELESCLRDAGLERFVYPALALTETLVPGRIEPRLLERLARSATPATRRVVAAVRSADLAPLTRRTMDAKLMWSSGPKERLLNLSELLVPSDDGLAVGLARLQWQRVAALAKGAAGWRARGEDASDTDVNRGSGP